MLDKNFRFLYLEACSVLLSVLAGDSEFKLQKNNLYSQSIIQSQKHVLPKASIRHPVPKLQNILVSNLKPRCS